MGNEIVSPIKFVDNFKELLDFEFQGENNIACLERLLKGDFEEIINQLQLIDDITEISPEDLNNLKLSEAGGIAREIILNDFQQLLDFGAQPSLNLLKKYEEDSEFDFISTDVYSYHVDQSPIATSTFLCTYFGQASEIIPNNMAVQSILIPEVREKLKSLYEGPDCGFEDFLKENFFDLHFEALPWVEPINLGVGNMCRLAIEHPQKKVFPCVHRAPRENGKYRLMLIC